MRGGLETRQGDRRGSYTLRAYCCRFVVET